MGDIGTPQREIEIIPMPQTVPVPEIVPEPVRQPEKQPA